MVAAKGIGFLPTLLDVIVVWYLVVAMCCKSSKKYSIVSDYVNATQKLIPIIPLKKLM